MAKQAKAKAASKRSAATETTGGGKFEAMLGVGKASIPAPSLVPVGTWTLKVRGAPKAIENEEDDTKGRVSFIFVALEPGEDVDPDEVARGEWKGESIFYDVYIEKASDWNKVTALLEKMGIDTSDGYDLADAKDRQVIATVGTRTYTNRSTNEPETRNTLRNFTAVE